MSDRIGEAKVAGEAPPTGYWDMMAAGPGPDPTPAEMRKMGPDQVKKEHRMDMTDSAKLQQTLATPSTFGKPPPQDPLVALLMRQK